MSRVKCKKVREKKNRLCISARIRGKYQGNGRLICRHQNIRILLSFRHCEQNFPFSIDPAAKKSYNIYVCTEIDMKGSGFFGAVTPFEPHMFL